MKHNYLLSSLLVLCMLAFASQTQAAVINVPADQATIQAAVNAAAAGDTVLVANGTYNESVNVGSAAGSITIMAANTGGATVDGGGTQAFYASSFTGDIKIEGFDLDRNVCSCSGAGFGAAINTSVLSFVNTSGVVSIVNNTFVSGYGGDAIYVLVNGTAASGLIIDGNSVSGSADNANFLHVDGAGTAKMDAVVSNNTIVGSNDDVFEFDFLDGAKLTATVLDNSLTAFAGTGSGMEFYIGSNGGSGGAFNGIIQGNTITGTTSGPGIRLDVQGIGTTYDVTVEDNTISNNDDQGIIYNTQSSAVGITARFVFEGNTINGNGQEGIQIEGENDPANAISNYHVVVRNNNLDGNTEDGILFDLDDTADPNFNMCIELEGNTVINTAATFNAYNINQAGTSSITLEQGGSASTVAATVIGDNNTGSPIAATGAINVVANGCNDNNTPATIGDFIWDDTDGDGIQDGGEPGLAGVLITLTGTQTVGGSVNRSTYSDADGEYLFGAVLPGSYTLTITPPAGYSLSPQGAGGNAALDSDFNGSNQASVTLTTDNLNVDAGLSTAPPCPTITFTFTASNEGCAGANDGTITLSNPAGGAPSYTYSIGSGYVASGSFTGLADGTYSASVRDANGCVSALVSLTIAPGDGTGPTLTCPTDPAPIEGCSATDVQPTSALAFSTSSAPITPAQYATEGGTSSEPIGTVSYQDAVTGPSVHPIIVTRTFTVTDACGNDSSCDQIFRIQDTQAPAITTCPPNFTIEGCSTADILANGNPRFETSPTLVTVTGFTNEGGAATDNCSPLRSITYQDAAAGSGPIVVTRTWTVEDFGFSKTPCTQTITIADSTAPVITCPANITQANDTGRCDVIVNYSAPTSTDNCGGTPTISQIAGQASGANFQVGVTTNTFVATDASGNSDTCSFTITVNDTENPTISCPGGGGGTPVSTTYNINTATNPAVGGICPGNSGIDNTYDCAFDNQPAIVLGTFTELSAPTAMLSSMDLVVYGACSGDVEFFLNGVSIGTGTASGLSCSCQSIASDPNIPQSYVVTVTPAIQAAFVAGGVNTLSVAATNSLAGAQCFYGADVNVTTGGGGGAVVVYLGANCDAPLGDFTTQATATDNCGTPSISQDLASSLVISADTTVVLTATDGAGNATSCSLNVTVSDTTSPTAVCQDITVQLDASGNATITAADIDNGSSDACGIRSYALDDTSYTCADLDAFPSVTLTITDNNSNTSTCTQTVTVLDSTSPTLVCQNITVNLDSNLIASFNLNAAIVSSTDNCTLASPQIIGTTSYDCNDVNQVVQVTITAVDARGNTSQPCTVDVSVADPNAYCCAAPVAICKQTATKNIDRFGLAPIFTSTIDSGSVADCGLARIRIRPDTLTCADIGQNTVTLTITDINGAMDSCTSTVTVNDVTPPTVNCTEVTATFQDCPAGLGPNNTTGVWRSLPASGIFSSTVGGSFTTSVDVSGCVSDNCGNLDDLEYSLGRSFADNITAGSIDLINVWIFRDTAGNVALDSVFVRTTIADTTSPDAVCQNTTVYLDGSGSASITAADVDGGSTDNCQIDTLIVSPNTFGCDGVLENVWAYSGVETGGNSNARVPLGMDFTVTDPGGIVVTHLGAFDDDQDGISGSIAVRIYRITSPTTGTVVAGPLTFTGSGDPLVNLHRVKALGASVTLPPGQYSIVAVGFSNADLAGNQSIGTGWPGTTTNGSGVMTFDQARYGVVGLPTSSFPTTTWPTANVWHAGTFRYQTTSGPNTVTLTATDVNGNTGTCTATVTVEDTIAPVISCPTPIVVSNDSGQCGAQVTVLATATDNCGGLTASSSPVTPYNTANNGNATTTNLLIPVSGLPASGSADLVISARGDLDRDPVSFPFDDERFYIVGEDGTVLGTTNNTPINCDPAYTTTTVSLTAAQLNAWGADGTVDIRLIPRQAGAIFTFCPGGNDAFATLTYTTGLVSSNDYNAGGLDASDSYPVGTTMVTFITSDVSGNSDTCTVTVTVNDTEAPTIANCPAPVVVCEDDTAFYATPTFDDNCDGAGLAGILQSGLPSGSVFPLGVNYAIWTYTDSASNVSPPCSVIVTVNPKPRASDTTILRCDGDFVDLDLQAHVDSNGNGVNSNFMWLAAPVAGVTGLSTTSQSGDVITDSLVNTTTQIKTIVYTVTPTSDPEGCVGPDFTVTVTLRPSARTVALPADICPGSLVDISQLLRDYSFLAFQYDYYDMHPDSAGATLIGRTRAWRGRSFPGQRVMVGPRVTTTYYVVATTFFGCTQIVEVPVAVRTNCVGTVAPIAMLEGAYDATTGTQRTRLQQQSLVPATEPYTAMGYTFYGGGGETMNVPQNLQSQIVDWVILELRDGFDSTHLVYSRAALLLSDGRIVDTDGSSNPAVTAHPTGRYYVTVIHRNHLAVMTATPMQINQTIDFSDPQTAVFGTSTTRRVVNGDALMYSGDADGNGQVQNTDDVMIWMPQAGTSGYKGADYNLDGQVQNTDRILIWNRNVGRGTAVPE